MAQPTLSLQTPLSTSSKSVMSYNMNWSALSEASTKNIEEALAGGKLLKVVREILETAPRAPVSIAVTGDSGNGMSSFINALRGIGHEEEDSAPTGVVRTTETLTYYLSSYFPNVALWDLPGIGADSQILENYLQEMQFNQFHHFIIVASEQFSMNHVKLAKGIQNMGKSFYVVWNKVDRDLRTSTLSEEQLLQTIRENIWENLQKARVREPPIFVVSSFYPLLHDFPKLRVKLFRDLPDFRCHGPIENLYCTCEKIINDKMIFLQEAVTSQSFQDIIGNNLGVYPKSYHSLFGVDSDSLKHLTQSMQTSTGFCRGMVKSQNLFTLLTGSLILSLLNFITTSYLSTFISHISHFGHRIMNYLRVLRHKRLIAKAAEDTKIILRNFLIDSTICSDCLPEVTLGGRSQNI